MLLRQFPDLHWLKSQANNRFADRKGMGGLQLPEGGWPNVVLNVRTRETVRDNIKGPLSLFSNLSGTSIVTVDGRRVKVQPGYFFLSNLHQHYTLEVDKGPATETFNIHFGEEFSRRAVATLMKPLGDFEKDPEGEICFSNRMIPVDESFRLKLDALRMAGDDPLQEEVLLFELLELLVQHELKLHSDKARISALKTSTREEIHKRLLAARDLVYSTSSSSPTLDEMASSACLSKFHFLRLFKEVYDETPVQFMRKVKVERAKELLKKTEMPVSMVASEVGFTDSSTFSRVFRKVEGVYPGQYRLRE